MQGCPGWLPCHFYAVAKFVIGLPTDGNFLQQAKTAIPWVSKALLQMAHLVCTVTC